MNPMEPIHSVEVPTTSGAGTYTVTLLYGGGAICTCQDYVYRGIQARNLDHKCKHIRQVLADPRLERQLAQARVTIKRRERLAEASTTPADLGYFERGAREDI